MLFMDWRKISGCGFSYPTMPESVMLRKQRAVPHRCNTSAIRMEDDRDTVPLADFMQLFGGAGANRVPVAGIADAGDELVADCVIFQSDLGEQLRVEHPPETVIGAAVLCNHPSHRPIELIRSEE